MSPLNPSMVLLDDDTSSSSFRWLEQVNTNTTTTSTTNNSTNAILQDSAILRDMGVVYGSLLVLVFFVFCGVRQAFPRPYTIRKWKEDLKVGQDICLSV
jgi:hypothetical protein